MISLSQADLQILKQKNTALYLKIQILSLEFGQYKVDDEISGSLMDLSIDVDADSDLRRSYCCYSHTITCVIINRRRIYNNSKPRISIPIFNNFWLFISQKL